MKAVSLVSKRDALSVGDFQQYYENIHCWLAMKYFPYIRYTRNHVVSSRSAVDFACISEFVLDPLFSGKDLMNSGSRAKLLADELMFMKPECIRVVPMHEQYLLGAADQTVNEKRYAFLFHKKTDLSNVVVNIKDWLATQVTRISVARLDTCVPEAQGDFPYAAILWLSLTEEAHEWALSNDFMGVADQLQVHTCATPESELRERFEVYIP